MGNVTLLVKVYEHGDRNVQQAPPTKTRVLRRRGGDVGRPVP